MSGRFLSILALAATVALPFGIVSPYYLHLVQTIAIYSVVALGLDVVFGYTGEVSVGHAALFGIGAYTAGTLLTHLGVGFWPALVVGPIVAACFGALLALPALRVTGPYLAMVTLAFGTIVQILINEVVPLTHGPLGIKLSTPLLFDWRPFSEALPFLAMPIKRMRDVQFAILCGVILMLTVGVVNRITASRFGRAFEALRDSPIASDCMGVSVYRHKVVAFVTSAGFAGLAGVLFTYSEQYVAPNDFSFELSVQFLLAVIVGGRKSRIGPILGAAIVVYLPNLLADVDLFRRFAGLAAVAAIVVGGFLIARQPRNWFRTIMPVALCTGLFAASEYLKSLTDYRLTVSGLMILFVVYYLPDGIVGAVKGLARPLNGRPDKIKGAFEEAGGNQPAFSPIASNTVGPLLQVRNLTKRFGGLTALSEIQLDVQPGSVHGLIGPNGSGKSTMMNLLSGIYTPTDGRIVFQAHELSGLKPPEIAALGVARTFQNVQLFGDLTLLENVLVGLHHVFRSTIYEVAAGLPRARREEAAAKQRAMSILKFVGLAGLAHEQARNLSYGKQRLLEIGRALALDPKLLLLDEPAAGLTAPDIKDLIAIAQRIRECHIAVILIEHHMDVVMSMCDTVTVLDFGEKIAEGRPSEVRSDPRVIEAYLGSAGAKAA